MQRREQLRKIEADDRFPCFACYDHPKDKLACNQCHGNGWLPGSHPMVQFAEDFIEQRISPMALGQFSHHQGQSVRVQTRMTSSEDPTRLKKEVFPSGSTKMIPEEEIRQSRKQDNSGELMQLYYCDECITKDPIKGLRYHCKECEDYDLCESCFLGGVHTNHAFEEVVPQKRKDNETLVAENRKSSLLRKSVKQ